MATAVPTLTINKVYDAGQEFRLDGKITFDGGDYAAGGILLPAALWLSNQPATAGIMNIKSGVRPHTITGSAFDSVAAKLYTAYYNGTTFKILLGGDGGEASGAMTNITVNISAWFKRLVS